MDETLKLREEIQEKTRRYFECAFGQDAAPFKPGETRINYAGRVFDEDELVALVDSALEFWLTHGRYAVQFEKALSDYLGTRWSLLVNSGSSANLLAFMALTSPLLGDRRIKRGDEVITVAAGFPTTISPIVQFGAVPVFIDIEVETANVRVNDLDQALSPKTKAVMLAHTLGNPFDLRAVKDFCDRNGLWLIEDNCDALGSLYDGRLTGTWGDIGTSSFYPAHHITTGEGGAVYTDNPDLKKIMLSLRDWGRDCCCGSGVDNTCGRRFSGQHGTLPYGYDHKYVYSHFGFNLKATDLQASIGCAQLSKLPGFIEKRRANFKILFAGLRDLDPFFILPVATKESDPSWFGFLMTLREDCQFSRNDIVLFLEKHRIQTRNLFGGNMVRQPAFSDLSEGRDYRVVEKLTNTDRVMNDSFWIGLYPGMGRESLDYMIRVIRDFVHRHGGNG
ncbi:lipopolysaccharide biosynthesis protein RfbH [Desulfosarcina alkanivorans]|uniref:Lipopolysaccharide biosynthesis protein RfbH n=1 Tax=Desulfosarcina alkanivorans TaxID=571177 RepID=A0A5K7YQ31_9BACT|nr:lipopolysaccharide biosynthesis protein RfbH [Desulfosarcina alkanivorans]BBO66727.1 lipopolysaccharide biosynthesis protein RfbH [Desulfosarcina alkanivorans]